MVAYIDPTEVGLRPYWAGATGNPILEGQNYYSPTKALKVQYAVKYLKHTDASLPPTLELNNGIVLPAPPSAANRRFMAENEPIGGGPDAHGCNPSVNPPTAWCEPAKACIPSGQYCPSGPLGFIARILKGIVNIIVAIFRKIKNFISPAKVPAYFYQGPASPGLPKSTGLRQAFGAPREFDGHTTIFGQMVQ